MGGFEIEQIGGYVLLGCIAVACLVAAVLRRPVDFTLAYDATADDVPSNALGAAPVVRRASADREEPLGVEVLALWSEFDGRADRDAKVFAAMKRAS